MAANTRSENVVLLDLRSRSPVTEYFIIATGTSPRQMRTVVDELRDLGKKMGFQAWHMNGYESARWIVLDCVNVVVHVFDSESRDFYDLELLWGDCPRIDWRKELGLPAAPEEERRADRISERFAESSGRDEMDAEEEDARLDGRDINEEEGDADVDEEAEADAPIVMELPDESTGSNSVEFVEIDPPGKRRQRGRAVYPTPIDEEEENEPEERSREMVGGNVPSLDEDDQERKSEAAADRDVEGVSDEDLPEERIVKRPMGGVSASLSSTSIGDEDEEDQEGSGDRADREQDHRDEIPEAHERAAEAVRMGNVELTTEEPGDRPRKKALRTRADMGKPGAAAPGPVNIKRAKAGVVEAGRGKAGVRSAAAKRGKPGGGSAKKSAAKGAGGAPAKGGGMGAAPARKAAVKKGPVKKASPGKAAAGKAAGRKPAAKKPAAKNAKPGAKKKR
jgi:ribosome-associated protein